MQRSGRLLERRANLSVGKRGLDSAEVEQRKQEEQQPEPKRQKVPALASVIVEALKMDSLQKLCSSLEPILRRVVSEEVERALAKLGPANIGARSPKRIDSPEGSLQLHFKSRLSLPLFTGGKVEGEQGAAIHVVLFDASTGHVVTSGPESSSKLDVVVLEGDFNNEDDDGWTEEDFEGHVVKEREGKRPILTGDLQVSLKEGVGTLGDLTFTDNSSWIRSRKFRLGLKVASGFCEGIRVREAKTEPFIVKDHRGELYKKHYPPAQKDEVWRLEKIGKDGSFHKRLNRSGIYTVEDFLRLVVRDSPKLRNVLGSGMSNKMWEGLVEHAKTCVLSGKHYVYYSDDTRNVGALFNNIYEFSGLIAGGQYVSADALSDNHKVFVDSLVKKAYDNWTHVVEYDGKVLLSSKESKETSAFIPENAVNSINYPSYSQVSLPRLQGPVSLEHTLMNSTPVPLGILDGRYDEQATSSVTNAHVAPDAQPQYALYPQQDQFVSSSDESLISRSDSTGLALGPQRISLDFQPVDMSAHPSVFDSYNDWQQQRDNQMADDFYPEEEIRMRSHQLLENDDMQQLLHVLNMGGASNSLADDNFAFPTFMPTPPPSYNTTGVRSRSGKAVVGWLKIKAAMRWGIFIRKKAAERRAQLVELED